MKASRSAMTSVTRRPTTGTRRSTDRPATRFDPGALQRFLVGAVALGMALLSIPAVTGAPTEPFILATAAMLVAGGGVFAWRKAGRAGLRDMFGGALHWRVGWGPWSLAVVGVPAVAVSLAAATGTLVVPDAGIGQTVVTYLFATFVLGVLFINLWEEAFWQGLVQRQAGLRHGVGRAAVMTALPFAILHLPLGVAGDAPLVEASIATLLLVAVAPPFRYLLGAVDRWTRGSLLVVAVLHASFNATGGLGLFDGGWQHIAAVLVLAGVALVTGAVRRSRGRIGAAAVEVATTSRA